MKKILISLLFLTLTLNLFAQVVDRYPIIQSPTETTVIIAWRTANQESSLLSYGTNPNELTETMSDAADKNKHFFQLTGLQPNTKYYYQVTSASLNPAVEYFSTAKPNMQAPFSFLHYGDCGYNNAIQNEISALMGAENADFAVVSGDVDQGSGDDYDDIYFGVYKDLLKHECHYTSIGNHDIIADGGSTYLDDFYLPSNNPQNTEQYYSFTWANAKFICLDSNIPYTQGTDQYEWLISELECNDRQWLFVFFHHPPYTNAWDITYYFPGAFYQYKGNVDMRTSLVTAFETYNVDFVLNGHSHCYQRGEMNGVRYVISGGAGASTLDFNTNSDSPNIDTEIYENQYVIFEVNGDTATYKCIDRTGALLDEVSATKAPAPQPTALTFSPVTESSIDGSFTPIMADNYLVVMSTDNSLTELPADYQVYTTGDLIGNGVVVDYSTLSTFNTTGLEGNTTYYFFIFPANDICTGPVYSTINPLVGFETTLLAGVDVFTKVLLEGPFNSTDGTMDDLLRQNGYLPVLEPYSALGFTYVNEMPGEAIDDPLVFDETNENAILDWVFVELRSSADPTVVLAARSALVQRDGDVVDVDGVSPLHFTGTGPGDYYVAIKHRNHLSVMTQSPVNTGITVDFSDSALLTYGTDAQKNIGGVMVLYGGDTTGDGLINSSDRSQVWNDRNLLDYRLTDIDMSGLCNSSDRSITWNNRNRLEQMP